VERSSGYPKSVTIFCFLFKLLAAKIISAVYGLVMMAVLVGIMLQINEDGPFAPSSLFFFIAAGEMVIAAFFHPQELSCLPAGIVYYVTIPSMYLLLIVYSIFNLNVVSWGTREIATKKSKMVQYDYHLIWAINED
jgi:chitin synthase